MNAIAGGESTSAARPADRKSGGNSPGKPGHQATCIWTLIGQLSPEGPIRSTRIVSVPFTVGRHPANSLCASNSTVSSRHAEFLQTADELFVRDLGSKNGTFLNGRRIEFATLIAEGDVVQFGTAAFKAVREPCDLSSPTDTQDADDADEEPVPLVQFDRLMLERNVVPHLQPIVDIATERPIGYEVLGRSRVFGLSSAEAMFRAAERARSEVELSEMLRAEGLRASEHLPGDCRIFVNTHPLELKAPRLAPSLKELRDRFPEREIVLEIHETAASEPEALRNLRIELREIGIGLSYDGFGSNESRLLELIAVPPDYLKFDLRMVPDIDTVPLRRREVMASLVRMLRDADVGTIALGVESKSTAECCREIGFQFAQGFYYGKPAPARSWLAGSDAGESG